MRRWLANELASTPSKQAIADFEEKFGLRFNRNMLARLFHEAGGKDAFIQKYRTTEDHVSDVEEEKQAEPKPQEVPREAPIPAPKRVRAPNPNTPEGQLLVLKEWREDPSLFDPSPELKNDPLKVSKLQVALGLLHGEDLISIWQRVQSFERGEPESEVWVSSLIRRHGGVAGFLEHVGYPPRIAKIVAELRKIP